MRRKKVVMTMYVVSYRDEMLPGKGIEDLKAFVKKSIGRFSSDGEPRAIAS